MRRGRRKGICVFWRGEKDVKKGENEKEKNGEKERRQGGRNMIKTKSITKNNSLLVYVNKINE